MTDGNIVKENISPKSFELAFGMFQRNPEFLDNACTIKEKESFLLLAAAAIEDGTISDKLNDKTLQGVPPCDVNWTQESNGEFNGQHGIRSLNALKKEYLNGIINDLLAKGIISPAPHMTASPAHVACNGQNSEGKPKFKLTVDARAANDTQRVVHGNIPNMQQCVQTTGGSEYYIETDALQAYFQMPATDELCKLLAFSCHRGTFKFIGRMPLGYKNAPVAWNNIMGVVFGDCPEITYYFDDIRASADTAADLLRKFRLLLQRCRQFNLVLSYKKTFIGAKSTIMCGYLCNKNGYSLTDEQKLPMLSIPFPASRHMLQKFLGSLTYLSNHVHQGKLLAIREIFRPHLKKDAPEKIEATPELLKAFEAARDIVHNSLVLNGTPLPDRPMYIETDASYYGEAAVLFQYDDNGNKRILRLIARSFQGAELNWSVFDKEGHAIYLAVTTFADLLFGRHTIVRTDHRNLLAGIFTSEYPRIVRMAQAMRPFCLEFEYLEGSKQFIADPLSRLVPDNSQPYVHIDTAALLAAPVAPYEPEKENEDDLPPLVPLGQLSQVHPEIKIIFDQVHNGVVGHMGINKTLELVAKALHNRSPPVDIQPPNLRHMIKILITLCPACILQHGVSSANARRLRNTELARHALCGACTPFSHMTIDFATPSKVSDLGYKYIFVAICDFTRFVIILPTVDETAETAAMQLCMIAGFYRMPDRIRSDRGPAFTSNLMKAFCKRFGMKQSLTIPHTPPTHGNVERVIKEIWRHLTIVVNTAVDIMASRWDLALPAVMSILNNQDHSTTGFAPVTLVFGTVAVQDTGTLALNSPARFLHEDIQESDTLPDLTTGPGKLDAQLSVLWKASLDFQEYKATELFIKSYQTSREFYVGDLVLLRNFRQTNGKVEFAFRGPFRVVKQADLSDFDNAVGTDPNTDQYGDVYELTSLLQDLPTYTHVRHMIAYPTVNKDVYADPQAVGALSDNEYVITEIRSHRGSPLQTGSLYFEVVFDKDLESTSILHRYVKDVELVKKYMESQHKSNPKDGWLNAVRQSAAALPALGRGQRQRIARHDDAYAYNR